MDQIQKNFIENYEITDQDRRLWSHPDTMKIKPEMLARHLIANEIPFDLESYRGRPLTVLIDALNSVYYASGIQSEINYHDIIFDIEYDYEDQRAIIVGYRVESDQEYHKRIDQHVKNVIRHEKSKATKLAKKVVSSETPSDTDRDARYEAYLLLKREFERE